MRKSRTVFTPDEIKAMTEILDRNYRELGDVMDIDALKWTQSVIHESRRITRLNRVVTGLIKAARSRAKYPHKHSSAADKKLHASPPPYQGTQTEMDLQPAVPAKAPEEPAGQPQDAKGTRKEWNISENILVYQDAFEYCVRHPGKSHQAAGSASQRRLRKERRRDVISGNFEIILVAACAAAAKYARPVHLEDEARLLVPQEEAPEPSPPAPQPGALPGVPADRTPFEARILKEIDDEVTLRVADRVRVAREEMIEKMRSAFA